MEFKDPKYKAPEEQFKSLFSKEESKKGSKITCPDCEALVPADHIHLEGAVAKCGECHTVFSIQKDLKHINAQPKEIEETPEGVEIIHFNNGLDVKWKPQFGESYKALKYIYGFVSLIFLMIFMGVAFASSTWFPRIITGTLFIVMSLPLPYLIAKDQNVLRFALDRFHLDIEQDPLRLPFMRKGFYFDTEQIEKIYSKKYKRWDTQKEVYELRVKTFDGKDTLIMKDLKHENQVRYVEQEINKYLTQVRENQAV